jgi:hypothetical protein
MTVKKMLACAALLASLAAPAHAQRAASGIQPPLTPELQKGAGLVQDNPPQTRAAEPAPSQRCTTPPNGDYYGESFFGPRAQQAEVFTQYFRLLQASDGIVTPELKRYITGDILADRVVTDVCGNEWLYRIGRPVVLQRAGRLE